MNFFAPEHTVSISKNLSSVGRKTARDYWNEELAKPANCFTFNWQGVVEEGIIFNKNHPTVGEALALVFDESGRYLLMDVYDRPTFKWVKSDTAMVRRGSIAMKMGIRGGEFPLFSSHSGDDHNILLFVSTLVPQSAKIHYPLYAGVDPSVKPVSGSSNEMLLSLNPTSVADVYLPDGRIAKVTAKAVMSGRIEFRDVWETLEKRIKRVEQELDGAQAGPHADRWMHELANMIRLSGRLPESRSAITSLVGKYVKAIFGGKLPSGMHKDFLQALKSVGEEKMPWWIKKSDEPDLSLIDQLGKVERKGPPKQVQMRKAARSQRDQADRNGKKGPSIRTEPNHKQKKGGKK